MNIGKVSPSSVAASGSYISPDLTVEEKSIIKDLKQFDGIKQSFLKARRIKNYDDMLLLGEALNGLCNGENKEAICYLAEALFTKKEFERTVHLLNRNMPMLHNDPQLTLIHAEAMLRMGGPSIKECLVFLENASKTWTDDKRYDPLKILLGEVCEMHTLQHKALRAYQRLYTIRPVYTKIIKKLFGSFALTMEEEIQLIKKADFNQRNIWAMHLALGLVCASRNVSPDDISITDSFQVQNDESATPLKFANCILFKSNCKVITLKDAMNSVDKSYPTAHLPAVLKYSTFNISIHIRRTFHTGDYTLCFALGKMLIDSLLVSCLDILPIYINCCVLLGLPAELRSLIERMTTEKADDSMIYFAKGNYFLLKPEYEKSIKCFKASMDCCKELLNSVFLPSQIALGHALSFNNAPDQALRAYYSAANIFSGYYAPHLYMGMEFSRQGCYSEAANCLNISRKLSKDNCLVEYEIGIVLLRTKQFEAAIQHLSKAVELSASSPHLLNDYYQCTLAKAYFDKALFDISLRSEDKRDSVSHAISNLTEALRINYANMDAHALLGICKYYVGHFRCAREHLSWALVGNSGNAQIKEVLNSLFRISLQNSEAADMECCNVDPKQLIGFDGTNALHASTDVDWIQLDTKFLNSVAIERKCEDYFRTTGISFFNLLRKATSVKLRDNELAVRQVSNALKQSEVWKPPLTPTGVFEKITQKHEEV